MEYPTRIEYEIEQLRRAGREVDRINDSTILVSTKIPGKEFLAVEYPQGYPLLPFLCSLEMEIKYEDTAYSIFGKNGWNAAIHLNSVISEIEKGITRANHYTDLYDKKLK